MMTEPTTLPYKKADPKSIQDMFGKIARSYDRGNAILSFQMHRLWNRALIQRVLKQDPPGSYLDLCCGTGAISLSYLAKRQEACECYMLDFCKEMLEVARHRASTEDVAQHSIHYLQADAQEIPLLDESVDCATVAYGIRNVADPKRCIQDVYRVLRPNGRFGILELTRPENRLMRLGHRFYLGQVLPRLGRWVLEDGPAYDYLCNSIQNFVSPDMLVATMLECGFEGVTATKLHGGIATLIEGRKG